MLEMACITNAQGVDDLLATVISELELVITGLDALDSFPLDDKAGVSAVVDMAMLEPLLRELHGLIANDNVDATRLVGRLEPLLSNTEYVRYLDPLVRAVEGYDFESAMAAFRQLSSELNIDL